MAARLSPIGFWSYARQDEDAEGRLSSLRSVLSFLLQTRYGREPVRIFQDVAAIPPGAEWERKIRVALNDSTFFIPIITPSFIQSQWCNEELFIFREREKEIARHHPELRDQRRIFPIYFVDIDGIEAFDSRLVPELRRLQWLDFRELIFEDVANATVKRSLSTLATSIRNLLLLKVGVDEPVAAESIGSTAAPSDRPAPAVAPAEPQAEPAPDVTDSGRFTPIIDGLVSEDVAVRRTNRKALRLELGRALDCAKDRDALKPVVIACCAAGWNLMTHAQYGDGEYTLAAVIEILIGSVPSPALPAWLGFVDLERIERFLAAPVADLDEAAFAAINGALAAASPYRLARPSEGAGEPTIHKTYEMLKQAFAEQRPSLDDPLIEDALWRLHNDPDGSATLVLSYETPHYDAEATFAKKTPNEVELTFRVTDEQGRPMHTVERRYRLDGGWTSEVIRNWHS